MGVETFSGETPAASVPPPEPPVGTQDGYKEFLGEHVLNDARDFLARFCRFPTQAALDVVTLWVAHTYVVDSGERLAFDTTPRLAFVSDEPASGKTRALDMLNILARKGRMMVDPTPATFAIAVGEKRVVPLIDEIDILFGAGNAKSVLRSLLNSGYKRGATWDRANKDELPVFAPVAMAGLAQKFLTAAPLSTLRSRSIVIRMRKARKAEPYKPREHDPLATAISRQLELWASANVARIVEAWPDVPEGVEDRLAEVWEPLLMLAEAAGGHWPETAVKACRELALGESDVPPEVPVSEALLADVRTVFMDAEVLPALTIVERLFELPESRWAGLWPHRETAAREMAAILGPLGIAPVKVETDDGMVRGYERAAFEGAR